MPKSDDRSLSAARLIEADCGRFESQWKGGHQPRIEQFVDATPELRARPFCGRCCCWNWSYGDSLASPLRWTSTSDGFLAIKAW